jgi:hypothetical protein
VSLARQNVEKLRTIINVKDYGARGDGVTDDTAAIQSAYTAVTSSGATISWSTGTYKTSASIVVKSNTITVFDAGAKLDPVPLANFTVIPQFGTLPGPFGYALFINEHFTSSSSMNYNIGYFNVRVVPTTGVYSWYGGTAWNGHFIDSRNVQNLTIQNCYAENMADFCGVLKCKDVVVRDNWAYRMSNATYDFWEGCENVVVRDNVAIECNNGVNWNSADTANNGTLTSQNAVIEANTIIGRGAAGGIYVAPLNVTSTTRDVAILNNFIDLQNETVSFPNGIAVQNSTNIKIIGNTIRRISAAAFPIIISVEGALESSDCIVSNNVIKDCTLTSGTYIAAYGERHIISENLAINATAANGIHADTSSTIAIHNRMIGATTPLLNATRTGTPTTPVFEQRIDTTNAAFLASKVVCSSEGFASSADYAVTATGTNLATAYQITKALTFVSITAASTGVKLPTANAAQIGREYVIWNQGASTLTVYAQTGDVVNGGASTTIASGGVLRVICPVAALFISA